MRRGILGGTFDPPHLAHLVAAETAYRQLGLDMVTFIPAGSPWQKAGRRLSAPEHRWEMTRRTVEGVKYFLADDREVLRDGPTYTIDTLASLPAEEGVVLILGSDAAAGLPTWHRWEEVIARAEVAVAPRPGTSRADVEDRVGCPFHWMEMPELPVSGTMIRRRAQQGASIRFLVADAVWRYVVEHDLYGPAA